MARFIRETILFLFLVAAGVSALYSVHDPEDFMAEYDVKMRMVENRNRGPSVILLGGSATAFGYCSGMLEDSIGMPVINAGLHAGMGQLLIAGDIAPRLRKGDIVIYSPEYDSFDTYGGYAMNNLLAHSEMFDRRLMEPGHWRSVVSNIPLVLTGNVKGALSRVMGRESVYSAKSFNKYGDLVAHWQRDDKRYNGGEKGDSVSGIDTVFVSRVIERLQGAAVYYYPPPLAESSYPGMRQTADIIGRMFRERGIPCLCDAGEELYPDTFFYDTRYHLRKIGAERRTRRLIDLITKLKVELCESCRSRHATC